jgi:4-amino-4-deoxy-L-arabinose transferase-like glycosyltransferase
MKAFLIVLSACLLLYFPGLSSVPFYTRGEPREALVAREMITTGDWLVPSRPDGELTRKPPLFYWAAAATTAILPDRPELAARLPSALLATAGVLVTWAVGRAAFGGAVALPAALVLATSLEWLRAGTIARVDMALAAGTTLLLGAWLLALARNRPRPDGTVLATGIAGATMATLAKGPVALALPGLVVVTLMAIRRDWSLLRRLGVVPILVVAGLLAALWYGAAFAKHGWAFFDIVAKENWLRFVDSEDAGTGHSHGALYLPLVGLVGLLPWTPLLPLAIAPAADRDRRAEAVTLLVCWTVVILLFFSAADAKRSVYLLPIVPALALLLGLGVDRPPGAGWLPGLTRAGSALYPLLFAGLGAGALALASGLDVVALVRPWLKPRDAQNTMALVAVTRDAAVPLLALGLGALVAAGLAARARRGSDWRGLVGIVAVLTVAWSAGIGHWIRPPLGRAASLEPFMQQVDRLLPADATLRATWQPDAGLRFYAPRPLFPWKATDQGPAFLLLWEDERRQLRDPDGAPLPPIATSEARQSRRGPLTLVVVPDAVSLRRTAPGRPADPDRRD